MFTWTSKRAQKMALYPKIESISSIGSIILAILEVQVCGLLGRYLFQFRGSIASRTNSIKGTLNPTAGKYAV